MFYIEDILKYTKLENNKNDIKCKNQEHLTVKPIEKIKHVAQGF